jgi:putative SOS response-associated peptidase YedK
VCGRYSSDLRWEDFAKLYDLARQGPMPAWNFEPSYNICPTDQVPVIIQGEHGRQLALMRWGLLPNWWSKPLKELRWQPSMRARSPWPRSRSSVTPSNARAA